MQELLDELDVIECYEQPRKTPMPGEVLKKQEEIYRAMDVTPLYASQSKDKKERIWSHRYVNRESRKGYSTYDR